MLVLLQIFGVQCVWWGGHWRIRVSLSNLQPVAVRKPGIYRVKFWPEIHSRL